MLLTTLLVLAVAADSAAFIRVNQVGYLPDAPKVAVVCALRPVALERFTVEDERGRTVLGPLRARRDGALGAQGSTSFAPVPMCRHQYALVPTSTAGSPTR
jgi:hypothetical protein